MRFLTQTTLIYSLYLLALNTSFAQTPLSFRFQAPEREDLYFKQYPLRSRIITNAQTLEFTGKCEEQSIDFVLFSLNGKDYPQYLTDGVFSRQLHLDEGRNLIEATLPQGFSHKEKYEIILLRSGFLQNVNFKYEGAEDEQLVLQANANGAYSRISVKTPQIRVVGKRGLPDSTGMSVKDQFGNPILVETTSDQFFVNYTLRQGENKLTFRSMFEDRVFNTEELVFILGETISLAPDEQANDPGFVENSYADNRFICQAPVFHIKGSVDAIANGRITLSINNRNQEITVTDHLFTAAIPLAENALTTIKATLRVDDQVYFDYVEVTHVAPQAMISSLKEVVLNGTIIEEGLDLSADETNSYYTRSPRILISGDTKFSGKLPVSIHNLTTGELTPVSKRAGKFNLTVFLVEGENILQVGIGNSTQTLGFEPVKVILHPPIVFERINNKVITETVVSIEGSECQIMGRVPSVSRGLLTLKAGNQTYTVPIIEGYFDMDSPITLVSRETRIDASISFKNHTYSDSILVVSKGIDATTVETTVL